MWEYETHAYLLTDIDELKENGIDVGKFTCINIRLNEVFDFDSNVARSTKVELLKVLNARKARRVINTHDPVPPVLGTDDNIINPPNGDADVPIIFGGNGSPNPNSPIIRG